MSRVIRYEPCPKCRERGKDSRGDNLVRYDDDSGHCFSCRHHEFPKHYTSVKPKVDHNGSKSLPPDWSRDVPADAWRWVLQYGLPYSYWQEHCGYSEAKGKRLVFTVGKPIQFSIGRLIGGVPEEATHGDRRKWYVWGDSHKHCEVVNPQDSGRRGYTVLTEDLISAHKVGQVCEAIPLFGVEVHPCHIWALNASKRPVVLWLDADQGGSSHKKAARLQSLINKPVHVVHTEQDPKCLKVEQIVQVLDNL